MTLQRPMFPPRAEPRQSPSKTAGSGPLRIVASTPAPITGAPAASLLAALVPVEAAEFNRRVRDRIRLLAAERGLPNSEIEPMMVKLKHYEVAEFVSRNRLSYDWLLWGCLKGRLRMAKALRDPSWLKMSTIEGGKNA